MARPLPQPGEQQVNGLAVSFDHSLDPSVGQVFHVPDEAKSPRFPQGEDPVTNSLNSSFDPDVTTNRRAHGSTTNVRVKGSQRISTPTTWAKSALKYNRPSRSEERRVGKERSSRGNVYHK